MADDGFDIRREIVGDVTVGLSGEVDAAAQTGLRASFVEDVQQPLLELGDTENASSAQHGWPLVVIEELNVMRVCPASSASAWINRSSSSSNSPHLLSARYSTPPPG